MDHTLRRLRDLTDREIDPVMRRRLCDELGDDVTVCDILETQWSGMLQSCLTVMEVAQSIYVVGLARWKT